MQEKIILVVDDNPEDREVIRRYLKKISTESYQILEADTGEEGVLLCRSDKPDCVILDYRLPDMDGFEFLTEIKGQDTLPTPLPVIMLTGQGDETIAAKSIKLGAQDYLIKNQITAETLKSSISNSIEKFRVIISLQKTERKLLEREKIFHALLEHSNDFIVIINSDNVFTFASPSVKQFGYISEELFGGYLGNFIHPEDHLSLLETIAEVRKYPGNSARLPETRIRRADGSFCPVEGTLSNLSYIPDLNGIVINGRDITERKKIEAVKLSEKVNLLKEEKRKSLEKMTGSIAHIFNNKLTVTVGYLDLAKQMFIPGMPGTDEVLRAEKSTIEAVRLSRLMLTTLGQIPLNREEIHSDQIIQAVIGSLKKTTPSQIRLKFIGSPATISCWADKENVFKILHNLIVNAIEAIGTAAGNIILTTGKEYCGTSLFKSLVTPEKMPEGYYSYITVADDGCGMDARTLSNIYDPFSSSKFVGRGLGMAEVLGLIRANDGAISTYSEPGKGTVAKVYLPAAEDYAESNEKISADNGWQGSGTVLLVDDEKEVLDIHKSMLTILGFEVLTARDGVECIEIFKKKIDLICCVLLNMNLHKQSSNQVLQELKNLKNDVAVIITSGFLEEQIKNEFSGIQPTGFLHNPFSLLVLKRKLQECCNCSKI